MIAINLTHAIYTTVESDMNTPWPEVMDVSQFPSPIEELVRVAARESQWLWYGTKQLNDVSKVIYEQRERERETINNSLKDFQHAHTHTTHSHTMYLVVFLIWQSVQSDTVNMVELLDKVH